MIPHKKRLATEASNLVIGLNKCCFPPPIVLRVPTGSEPYHAMVTPEYEYATLNC